MARHVITLPYPPSVGGAGEIIWDDEAGTVEGSHPRVGVIQWTIQELGIPTNLSRDGRTLVLNDPLHDPAEFWYLLPSQAWREPVRSTLPAILLETEPAPVRAAAAPTGVVDGVRRPLIEGVDFVW